ncbi:MAG TPA: cytochrome c [Candidatus Methylacidiphilales bacterium]|nr:cytochrome c [Candidatus Methylacidiphilales bacterium]
MKRFFLGLPVACLLAGCTPAPETPQGASPQVLEAGHQIYTANCATCHQVDGYGVENMQPALVNDDIVAGDPQMLVRVLLKGPAAVLPPDRPHYSNTMPVFARLTDEQIADVLTFIRHDYGNQASPISAQQVQTIRAQSGS